MATMVEEARHKLQLTAKEREEFANRVLSGDQPPTIEEEQKLEAMINGEADLRAELGRLEKFDQAGGSSKPANSGTPNPVQREAAIQRLAATLGERFVSSDVYKAALQAYAPSGRLSDTGKFETGPFGFKGLNDFNAALMTGLSDTSGGAFVITDRQRELVPLGRQPLRMRDVVRNLQTTSDLIDYVAQTSRTNNAAIVAEATGAGDGTGIKPESALAYVVRQAPVYTMANWIPVTRQAVADVPQLRGMIDTELRDNLEEKLEDKMVNGSGTGEPFGLLQTSGRQSQAWDTNILTTTRKARTKVRTVGRAIPEAYLLNPSDWETIDLLQDNEARYFYGGPAQVGVPRLWGLPAVEVEAVAAGTGIVGQLTKAILWDRENANVRIGEPGDFFLRNLLALLAELRAAFALTQPSAIVEIDLTA